MDKQDSISTAYGRGCRATTAAGKPCRAAPLVGSEYCFMHDPAKVAERKAARAKGGHARHGRTIDPPGGADLELATVADVIKLVKRAVRDTLALENSIARNRTLGYLAGVAIKVFENGELEQRLAELERVFNERKE